MCHLCFSRFRAKDAYREKTLAKKQSGSVGDGSSGGNSEEAPDGVANVRSGGQGSSLLRSRVTYGSFYLRMGAMCEYRAGLKVGPRLRECFGHI